MSNEVTTRQPVQHYGFSDLTRMAEAMFKSGFYGYKSPEQVISLMLVAQAEGLHPAIVARDFHLIENKPSLKSEAMLSRFQSAGGKVEWIELSNTVAKATFTAPGSQPLTMEWTIEQAKTAGLVRNNQNGSPGMWIKYPRPMLRSRLVSEAIRTVMPGVLSGSHTPEEVADGDVELRDITPPREKSVEGDIADLPIEAELIDRETGEVLTPPEPAATDTPIASMSAGEVADHLAAIEAAATLNDLKAAHAKAYTRAHSVNDVHAMARFMTAKDGAKEKLAKEGAAP